MIQVSDEVIAHIKVTLMDTMGWVEEGLKNAWKTMFPLTQESRMTGYLDPDHLAWAITPNPWWKFLTDVPLISWEEVERLNKQQRPSMVPHYDESGWLIQERRVVDFKGSASAHMGNHQILKLVQILAPVQNCDLLICCKEDILGILKYLMIWKPDWIMGKDPLQRMG